MKIVDESFSIDTSEPGFVHVRHVEMYEGGADRVRHVWFERASLPWVVEALRACARDPRAFVKTGMDSGNDSLLVFGSGSDYAPEVDLFNYRPKDAPHGGDYTRGFSQVLAKKLAEDLAAIEPCNTVVRPRRIWRLVRPVEETYALDISDTGFIHIHTRQLDESGLDMGGHLWFERTNLPWVVDQLRDCLAEDRYLKMEERGSDDLSVSRYDPGMRFVMFRNRRLLAVPHGGTHMLLLTEGTAQALFADLAALE